MNACRAVVSQHTLVATPVMTPRDRARVLGLVLGIVVPFLITALLVTQMRRFRWLMLPITAFDNCLAGLIAVLLCFNFDPPMPAFSAGTASLVVFFAYVVFRLSPAMASARRLDVPAGWPCVVSSTA